MRNIANVTIFFALVLLLDGCKKKEPVEKNMVTINPNKAEQSVNLSEIVDNVSYIKLETNADCIMGAVREIIIKKKYIYAIDQSQMTVFVFDKRGKFISKLNKRGEGPGEYIKLGPVFISDNEDYIEVIDLLGKDSRILKYSNIKFDLLKEHAFSAPSANSCRKVNDIYYFSSQQIENFVNGESTNADIIIADDNKIKKAIFKKKISTQGNTFSPNSESFTKNDKGELFASLMYNNTFFKLSNMDALPILTVDFGKYSIDNSIGLKSTKEQQEYLDKSKEVASFPVLNANSSNVLAFSYYFKENSKNENKLYQYIKIKKSNKVFHTKEIINDITNFPNKIYISSCFFGVNHEVLSDNFLVDIVLPWYHLKKNEVNVSGIGKVKINDNPIILLMKLKG